MVRSKETFFIHSLAQRTNQETSTPTKSPPILGDLTEKLQKPPAFRLFWYRGTRDEISLSAGARKGTRDEFLSAAHGKGVAMFFIILIGNNIALLIIAVKVLYSSIISFISSKSALYLYLARYSSTS